MLQANHLCMNVRKRKHTGKFFVQEHLNKTAVHGGIGLVDIERILLREQYTPINFPYHHEFTARAKFFRVLYLLQTLFRIPSGSTILFQFPMYAGMNKMLVRLLRFRYSITIICLVADINGLKDGNERLLQKELVQLRRHRCFVVHNERMERWLSKQVRQSRFSRLVFFDFLAIPARIERSKSHTIVFAGNLAKSLFLEQLGSLTAKHQQMRFNLYGPGLTALMETQHQTSYKGAHDPYLLPAMLEGAFGLVWDGDSINGPAGSFGDYMQYITHHKVSLYILAGMPIIIYENAGSAGFIRRNNIGFTIRNLYEINDKISELGEAEYRQMVVNLKEFAADISAGKRLVFALESLDLRAVRGS